MAAVRKLPRPVPAAALLCGLAWVAVGCTAGPSSPGDGKAAPAATHGRAAWREPASYTYTLTSSEGERPLIGTFRVTVRDHRVAGVTGLDDSGRRVVRQSPDAVPTIGGLLAELRRARHDGADTADASYAADGHPLRITLDWNANAIDDEAVYVITAYRPTGH